jgi:hypothetical protein
MALDDLRRLGAKLQSVGREGLQEDFEMSKRRGGLEGSRPRTRLGSPGTKHMAGEVASPDSQCPGWPFLHQRGAFGGG